MSSYKELWFREFERQLANDHPYEEAALRARERMATTESLLDIADRRRKEERENGKV